MDLIIRPSLPAFDKRDAPRAPPMSAPAIIPLEAPLKGSPPVAVLYAYPTAPKAAPVAKDLDASFPLTSEASVNPAFVIALLFLRELSAAFMAERYAALSRLNVLNNPII
nr:MAG TPA: hypothetical protein [Bacteriophage sp.]